MSDILDLPQIPNCCQCSYHCDYYCEMILAVALYQELLTLSPISVTVYVSRYRQVAIGSLAPSHQKT